MILNQFFSANFQSKTMNSSSQSKNIKRKIIQCFLALILLAASSYLIKDHFNSQQDSNLAKEAEAESRTNVPEFDSSKVSDSLKNYLTNLTGNYGYHVIDLNSNQSFGFNQENKYFMASTYKIAVSAYLYNQIEQGKINPQKKLIYDKKFHESGTGILQYEKPGQSYKINYLNTLMIQKSDNVAANILLNYLGVANIQNFIDDAKINGLNIYKNTTTPQAMAQLLQKIYQYEIINQQSADQLIYLMINSITDSRLKAGLPANLIIAHKIGTYEDVINDVGIVYLNQRPYIISVYSKNTLKQNIAEIAIAEISRKVFNFENSL